MGKTQKARRREFRNNNSLLPHRPSTLSTSSLSSSSLLSSSISSSISSSNGGAGTESIASELGSLHEHKRYKACTLLSNLYASSVSHLTSLKKLTTLDILSKLSMRLMDNSKSIRYEAMGAIRNLALCKYPTIINQLIECGIVNILFTLLNEWMIEMERCGDVKEDGDAIIMTLKLSLQVLACMTNLLAAHDAFATAFCARMQELLPQLLRVFRQHQYLEIDVAIANLLFIASDNLPAFDAIFLGHDGIPILQAKIEANEIVSTHSSSYLTDASLASHPEAIVLLRSVLKLKCVGVFVNLAERSPEMARVALVNVQPIVMAISPEGLAMAELKKLSPHAIFLERQREQASRGELEPEEMMSEAAMESEETGFDTLDERGEDLGSHAQSIVAARSNVWIYAVEVVQLSAELLANLALHTSSDPDGEFEDVDDEDGEGDASSAGVAAISETLIESSSGEGTFPESDSVLSDLQIMQATSGSIHVLLDMLSTVAADGPIFSVYIVDIIECLDRLSACAANLVAHIPVALFPTIIAIPAGLDSAGVPISESVLKYLLVIFARSLERLFAYEAMIKKDSTVAAPSAALDASVASAENPLQSLVNNCGEDISTGALLRSLNDSALSALHGLEASFRLAPFECMQSSALDAQDAMLMQVIALALCKGILHPTNAVVLASVEAVAGLATKDTEAETVVRQARTIVSTKLNALLSNSLLRKIETECGSLSALHQTIGASAPSEQQSIVLTDGLNVLESCAMALIDLHSSDDLELLDVYIRLGAEGKLSTVLQAFIAIERVLSSSARHKKYFSKSQRLHLQETGENVSRFLEYKASTKR